MEVSQFSAQSYSLRPSQPQFNGMGDAVSAVVGVIDDNDFAALGSSDFLGMCVPRTAIEASMRPPGYRKDAARETAIREISGLFLNTLAVGWASYAMMRLIGNRVNWYNPHGIPGNAWISADSLESFGKIYERILHEQSVQTPQQARAQFVQAIVDAMTSSDRKTRLVGILRSTEGMQPGARTAFLKSAFASNPSLLAKFDQSHDMDLTQRAKPVDDFSGKLSIEACKEFLNGYAFKMPSIDEQFLGITPFDQQAMVRTQELLLNDAKITAHLSPGQLQAIKAAPSQERFDRLLKVLPDAQKAKAQQTFVKSRLQLSLADMKYSEKDLMRVMDRVALQGGLTDTVQLLDDRMEPLIRDQKGRPLMMHKNRKALLKEMKHFLEQYVDRATHEARHSGEEWKVAVSHKLYGQTNSSKGFMSRFLINAEDGLIQAAMKSKIAYTYIPLIITIIISIGVAFYNNWLTQKKHGGLVISPIDGSSQARSPLSPNTVTPGLPSVKPESTTLMGSALMAQNAAATNSPFAVFQSSLQPVPGGVS